MNSPIGNVPLNETSLLEAAKWLSRRDKSLRAVLDRCGPPPLWKRPATFATLVRIVLEQQVSLASAKSTFERLKSICDGRVTGAAVGLLDDAKLRAAGLSRQKTRYVRELANAVHEKRFSVSKLHQCNDEDAGNLIQAQIGFGAWSADIYLMMALMRPDVLPTGDLGLVKGIAEVCDRQFVTIDEIIDRAESWRPWRSVATRMIWQAYLVNRRKDISTIAAG